MRSNKTMRSTKILALLLSCGVLAASAHTGKTSVVIYRCTDAFGALTVQNDMPCPKGSRQQKQVIQPPMPMPAYRPLPAPKSVAPPATIAPAAIAAAPSDNAVASEPVIADKDRLPPPPLFQCNTYDNDSYLSENATPEPRCVRLQTSDVQGSTDTSGAVACQMVTDQCQRVADGAACDAWKKRQRETDAKWKFGAADDAEANKTDYDRVQRIVRDSTCGN